VLEAIKTIFESAAKNGIYMPSAYDSDKRGPSVTLFFSHVTFVLAVFLTILLAFRPDVFTATVTCIMFWVMATVFYLIRRLKTFKADLDDRSIELQGEESKDEQEQPNNPN
jgi:predicted membrane channel-forming protein YqfA (hemolysin III family)